MSLSLEFSADKLRHLPQHLLQLCQCRIHAVRLIHSDILLPHLLPSSGVRTQSAHAHSHDIFMQIGDAQLAAKQIAEEEVRVGGYLIALVIQSLTLYGAALDVASGVQRQPSMAHFPQTIVTANPVAHHLVRVLRINKQSVTIQKIGMSLLKPLHYIGYCLRRIQKIIRMHQADDVTCSSPDSLVDSLIHTMVWLRDKLHLILMTSDSLTDNLSRLVLRSTIHDDIFDIGIILRQHTLHCTANCLLTVVTTSYNRNFHIF